MRVGDQKLAALRGHLRGGDHPQMIIGEANPDDGAEVDSPIVDFGLARLEPFGRLELDGDLRSFASNPGHRNPQSDRGGDDRNYPDRKSTRLNSSHVEIS